jgi:hypothetical protein
MNPFVSFGTSVEALDSNTTNRPSELMLAGRKVDVDVVSAPVDDVLTRVVLRTCAEAAVGSDSDKIARPAAARTARRKRERGQIARPIKGPLDYFEEVEILHYLDGRPQH